MAPATKDKNPRKDIVREPHTASHYTCPYCGVMLSRKVLESIRWNGETFPVGRCEQCDQAIQYGK